MSGMDVHKLIDPRYGSVIAESCAREARTTIVIVSHEYVIPAQQRNVYLQLEHILQLQPSIPILIEGFVGPRIPDSSAVIDDQQHRIATVLGLIEQKGRLAGEALAQLYPTRDLIFGIDNSDLLSAQQAEFKAIDTTIQSSLPKQVDKNMTSKTFLQIGFDLFSSILNDLEKHVLNPRLQNLLSIHEQFKNDGKVIPYANALVSIGQELGIPIEEGYPSISALMKATQIEETLDFEEVEKRRLALVEELSRHAHIPLIGERGRTIERWIETAQTDEERLLSQYSDRLGERPVQRSTWLKRFLPFISKAKESPNPTWLIRLLALSLGVREGRISQTRYYARLNDLMNCLGIELPVSGSLRKYIDYMLLADSIDQYHITAMELPSLLTELINMLVSSTREYGIIKLRQQLDDLSKLVQLKLPAARVRVTLAQNPSIVQWLTEVLRLGEYVMEDKWINLTSEKQLHKLASICSQIIEKLLPHVRDYYYSVCRRSYELINQTLNYKFGQIPVIVLVCGRFHLYEIYRIIRSNRELSWAVIVPSHNGEDMKERYHTWRWVFPDEEYTHA